MKNLDKIILGTVQFGLDYGINNSIGKPSLEQSFDILDLAFEKGIRTLDTAEAYGSAHEVLSEYHKQTINRFKIITKYKSDRYTNYNHIIGRVEHHLKMFDLSKLEGYLFHSFDDFVKFDKDELKELQKSNLVKNIGVSVYTNVQLEYLFQYADLIKIVQLPFNLLDNHNHRFEFLKKAKNLGFEIHTRSTFLQGIFFKEVNSLPNYFEPIKPTLKKINDIASDNKISIQNLAFNYPFNKDYIDKVLIGVDSKEQLLSNIESLNINLSINTINQIESINETHLGYLNPANWRK